MKKILKSGCDLLSASDLSDRRHGNMLEFQSHEMDAFKVLGGSP